MPVEWLLKWRRRRLRAREVNNVPLYMYEEYLFDPQQDITAYELAMLIKHLGRASRVARSWYVLRSWTDAIYVPREFSKQPTYWSIVRRHFHPSGLDGVQAELIERYGYHRSDI